MPHYVKRSEKYLRKAELNPAPSQKMRLKVCLNRKNSVSPGENAEWFEQFRHISTYNAEPASPMHGTDQRVTLLTNYTDAFMDSLKVFALLISFAFSALNPVLAVDGETATQEKLLAAAKLDPYTVNPGDVLLISVWKEEDLEGEVLVRPDGYFSFPLAGEVEAAGKTVDDIRRDITEQLQRYIPDIVVTVSTQQIGGNKVYVIGQVNRPGDFLVNPRVDVMQALALAGGMTPFADVNDITILRRKGHVRMAIPFRYRDLERGKRLEQNIILQPGDVVVVP